MSRSQTGLATKWVAVLGAFVIAVAGCSTDSPTAPVQQPGPPPGTGASADWNITVKSSPKELTRGATDPATISVTVRRADNNQPPPQGTTVVLSTSLGEFNFVGSTLTSIALATANGRADAFLFAGAITGTALVTARLENSAGQMGVPIVAPIDPVVASFSFQNSNNNLSVQFQDTSTGNPTKWRWDFGDGSTSKEQNPAHLYDAEGDYVVTLTASKKGSEDTTSQIVSVTEDPDDIVEANFEFTVSDREVLFQDTSTGNPTSWRWDFGDGNTSSAQNPRHVYSNEGNYVVTLRAANRRTEDTVSKIVSVAEGLFIIDVSPEQGPFGTEVTITGQGFFPLFRVLFGGIPAVRVISSTNNQIVAIVPRIVEDCDDDMDTVIGQREVAKAVDVTVEKLDGTSTTIPNAFTFVPTSTVCVGD